MLYFAAFPPTNITADGEECKFSTRKSRKIHIRHEKAADGIVRGMRTGIVFSAYQVVVMRVVSTPSVPPGMR